MIWTILGGTILTLAALLATLLIPGNAAPNPLALLVIGLGGTGAVATLQYRIACLKERLETEEIRND